MIFLDLWQFIDVK